MGSSADGNENSSYDDDIINVSFPKEGMDLYLHAGDGKKPNTQSSFLHTFKE